MIIGRAANAELMRTGMCEVIRDEPPERDGGPFWVRPSAMSDPSTEAYVHDCWLIKHGEDEGRYAVLLKRVRPLRVRRKKAEQPEFKVTRAQRSRIFAGDDAPLLFDREPACEKGMRVILSWTRPRKVFDEETRRVSEPPREPLVWIEITGKARRKAEEGGWEVRFRIEDHRSRARLVRQTPPVLGQDIMRLDLDHEPTDEEKAAAREESGYTTSPRAAVDHLEAIDDDTLDRYVTENASTDADRERERRERWEQMSLKERAAALEALAHVSNVDVSKELRLAGHAFNKALEKIDRHERGQAREAA